MSEINSYFKELLTQGKDVYLPGIGTFSSAYQPATVHPIQHIFQPPSLRVNFSGEKKGSENLIQHIAFTEKISRSEAEEKINRFSVEIINSLNKKNSYQIDEVGELVLNPEKKIIFIQNPENILDDSFGLPSFTGRMIARKANGETGYEEKPRRKFKFRFGIFFFIGVFLFLDFEFLTMAVPLNNFNLLRDTRISTKILLWFHPPVYSTAHPNAISNWVRLREPAFWRIEQNDTFNIR